MLPQWWYDFSCTFCLRPAAGKPSERADRSSGDADTDLPMDASREGDPPALREVLPQWGLN